MSEKIVWNIACDGLTNRLTEVVEFLKSQQPLNNTWSEVYFLSKLSFNPILGSGYLFYAEVNNTIVGVASLTKKRGVLHGSPCILAEVGDTFVSREVIRKGVPAKLYKPELPHNHYLNRSIFAGLILRLEKKAGEDGVCLIYGTPNANSLPGYVKHLGFVQDQRYKNTTYYRPMAQGIISKIEFLSPLRQPLFLLDRIFNTLTYFCFAYLRRISIERHQDIEPILPEIGELWRHNSQGVSFGLERGPDYWHQRYSRNMAEDYIFLTLRNANRLIVGFVVLRTMQTSEHRRGLAIVEWIGKKDISILNIIAAVMNQIDQLGRFSHVFFWAGGQSYEHHKSLLACLFVLRKDAPIIFKGLNGNGVPTEGSFIFHLGSSDAI